MYNLSATNELQDGLPVKVASERPALDTSIAWYRIWDLRFWFWVLGFGFGILGFGIWDLEGSG